MAACYKKGNILLSVHFAIQPLKSKSHIILVFKVHNKDNKNKKRKILTYFGACLPFGAGSCKYWQIFVRIVGFALFL